MDVFTLIIMIAWLVSVAVTYNIIALIGAVCFFGLGYCVATRYYIRRLDTLTNECGVSDNNNPADLRDR
jgi:positive regulator of sigma E activity